MDFAQKTDKILFIGCCNNDNSDNNAAASSSSSSSKSKSVISANELYDAGFENIVQVDASKTRIREEMTKNLRLRPKMKWNVAADMTKLNLEDVSQQIVVDNGTTIKELFKSNISTGCRYLEEIKRICSDCFVVTLDGNDAVGEDAALLETILSKVFLSCSWRTKVKVVQKHDKTLTIAVNYSNDLQSDAPPIVVETETPEDEILPVLNKLVTAENAERAQGKRSALDIDAQWELAEASDFDKYHPGRFLQLKIKNGKGRVRYHVAIYDKGEAVRGRQPQQQEECDHEEDDCCGDDHAGGGGGHGHSHGGGHGHSHGGGHGHSHGGGGHGHSHGGQPCSGHHEEEDCGIFLVPQGREHEWMYNDPEGIIKVGDYSKYKRLMVVRMLREEHYGDLKSVQKELNPVIMKYAPQVCKMEVSPSIPYVTAQEGIGERDDVATITSQLQGPIVVEDVPLEQGRVRSRRMVFLQNQGIVQSEIRMVKAGKKQNQWQHVFEQLCLEYHRVMEFGLELLPKKSSSDSQLSALVIGLGGGPFPMNLAKVHNMKVSVVELDPAVVQLAKQHFGVSDDISVRVGDGVQYVKDATLDSKVDFFVIDAGSADGSMGMSCPPASFLELDFLSKVKESLVDSGVLTINCVTRSQALFHHCIVQLKHVFPHVFSSKIDGDVNRVLFAMMQPPNEIRVRQLEAVVY